MPMITLTRTDQTSIDVASTAVVKIESAEQGCTVTLAGGETLSVMEGGPKVRELVNRIPVKSE